MKQVPVILVLILSLSACGEDLLEGDSGSRSAACFRDGQTFQVGQKWMEDCNQCMCRSGGLVACTLKLCVR